MKELLEKFYNTDNVLSLLLLEAKNIAEEHNDVELINYLNNEINGYNIKDGLPEYRKIRAQIVCDVKDVYGRLAYKEKPIDFKILSDQVGFDLDDSYIPDGISFVETSLKNLTQSTSLKPIPKQLVKMLDNTFHHNNRNFHLEAAYHLVPTTSIEYVLVKVRQNLIIMLQNLNRKIEPISTIIPSDSTDVEIKNIIKSVFITYAWDDSDFNSLVISFVDFLRKHNFDASMDRKKSQEESAINFNQMMIEGISNNDKVIIILTEKYKSRADKFEGGVGTEFKIIIEDMKKNKNKYIFASFGTLDRNTITPFALTGTDIIDLKDEQNNHNFNNLFSKLKEEPILIFSEVSKENIKIKKETIKPFRL